MNVLYTELQSTTQCVVERLITQPIQKHSESASDGEFDQEDYAEGIRQFTRHHQVAEQAVTV
jgi:hypothetical protein